MNTPKKGPGHGCSRTGAEHSNQQRAYKRSTRRRKAQRTTTLQDFHHAATTNGVTSFAVELLDHYGVLALLADSMRGDHAAEQKFFGLDTFLKRCGLPSGPVCLTCDHTFAGPTEPDAYVIFTPFASQQDTGLVSGLCARCTAKPERLKAAILNWLRTTWPDMREADWGVA